MPKIITSPVPSFPGTVTITTAPTMLIVENFMEAKFMFTVQRHMLLPDVKDGKLVVLEDGITASQSMQKVTVDAADITAEQLRERREKYFLAAIAFVEEWNIEGQPRQIKSRDDLNPIPFDGAAALLKWLFSEIFSYCMGERKIPKASQSGSTDTLMTPTTPEGQES